MKINDFTILLDNIDYESKNAKHQIITETVTYKLWESAGQKLMEAQLTTDQIQQLFQQVEQGATAAGGNRTVIGKGKDVADAVGKAWEDLKTKASTSGPIKNVDAMYDKAAEQLKQATGGDQGVMKYVQMYRDFAKKHPVAQSIIYSALIAAAGISGAGLGGAAALALFKLVDKLLQGEKFSSAAYQGIKTGAMAYGASKIGDLFRGEPQAAAAPSGSTAPASAAQDTLSATRAAVEKEAMDAIRSRIANGEIAPGDTSAIRDFAYKMLDGSGMPPQAIETSVEKLITRSMGDIARQAGGNATIAGGNIVKESIKLSESQIFLTFSKVAERQRKLDEGIMDTLKGAAGSAIGKAVDWAKTKGKNITTKVTADKLMSAWKKAGSPTDSAEIEKILSDAGVSTDVITQVYGSMKIPTSTPAAGAEPTGATPGAPSAAAGATPGAPSAAAGATPGAPPAKGTAPVATAYAQARKLIDQLDSKGKQRVIAALKKDLELAEGDEADYGPDYQDMVKRVGQLAKQGERKTVWDPVKRVYKTVPVNPPKQEVKEFAVDGSGDNGDNRSKFLGTVASLFKAGNKIDWLVPGQMGHVTQVKDDGVTMKPHNKPYSRKSYFLPMYDDSRDSKYTVKMVGPKHYKVVSSDPNWRLEEQGVAEGPGFDKWADDKAASQLHKLKPSIEIYKVLAVNKGNALSKRVKLKVKATSVDDVLDRLAMSDWYPLEINGVEVIDGKRLKQGVTEGFSDVVKGVKRYFKGKDPSGTSNVGYRSDQYIKAKLGGDPEQIRKAERNLDRVNKVTHGKLGEQGVAEGFFGIDDKIKGKIQNIVSRLSDEYGMWDHKAQTFTPEGLEHLKSILKFNDNYIKYALSLTSRDFEAEGIAEDWQKVNKKDKTDGMSKKAVKAYRRENPGSKLKTAVTTKPSKLKKGSKDAKRRKSFCARMSGMKKAHASAKTKRDPDSPINKALRRWNCESVEQLQELMMIAEQKIQEAKNSKQQAAIAIAKKKSKVNESKDMCSVCGQTPCNCTHASSIMQGLRG